jgi:hypothetical protein
LLQQLAGEQHVAGRRSNADHGAMKILDWFDYSIYLCLILAYLVIMQSTCSGKIFSIQH